MDGLSSMYGADLPLLSLTFARGNTARELPERMDVDPASVAVRTAEEFDEDFVLLKGLGAGLPLADLMENSRLSGRLNS